MNRNRHRMMILATALMAVAEAKEPGGKNPAPPAPARELVWPLPPQAPRIRWVGQYSDLDEIKGKRKQGWMERAAGAKPESDKLRLKSPYGVVADSRGRVFVADMGQRSVFVIDPAQKRVEMRRGSPQIPLATPIGLALDAKERLFVSDAFLHDILVFDAEGKVLAQIGSAQLERPAGIAVDKARNRLYAADTKGARIAVFNTETLAFERYLGGPVSKGGREPGRFLSPTNVAVDRNGRLIVADTFNQRVQIFDANGKFVRAFGTHGVRPGQFVRPKGVAVDSQGHIYVADAEFNNFQVFSPEGQILMAVGSLGDQPGEFVLIAGLSVDAEDRILTTEQGSGKVQVFKYLPQAASAAGKEATNRR